MSIEAVLFKKWFESVEKRLDFLTERSNKMAGEYEDLMQTIADERAQFEALKQSNDELVATLNEHIAALEAAAVDGIVVTPAQIAALKDAVKGIVPDEQAPVLTPEPMPADPVVEPAPIEEPAPADPAPVDDTQPAA